MKPTPENSIGDKLRKWLAGDATLQDERNLDQLAEEDPFLKDALEGYRQFTEDDHQERLNALKAKLQKQPSSYGSTPVYRLPRIAAAVALLLALGSLWFYINSSDATSPLTMDREIVAPEVEEERIKGEDIASTVEEKALAPEDEAKQYESEQSINTETEGYIESSQFAITPNLNKDISANSGSITQGDISAEDIIVPEQSARGEIVEEVATETYKAKESVLPPPPPRKEVEWPAESKPATEIAEKKRQNKSLDDTFWDLDEEIVSQPSPIATVERDKAPDSLSEKRLIVGVVKGDDGFPLMGASVVEIGTENGAITDFNGRFRLELEESKNAVEANFTGFSSQRLDVSTADNVEFVLDQSNLVLEEVAVTSPKKEKKESNLEKRSSRARAASPTANVGLADIEGVALPVGGFEQFEKYLKRNLNYPSAAKRNKIKGKVRVQFTIELDGTLSNFIIIQSLGYGCDKEAIRLLKEGPKWVLNSEGPVITSYAIKFK